MPQPAHLAVLLALTSLAACGGEPAPGAPEAPGATDATSGTAHASNVEASPLEALRANVAATAARDEHGAAKVTVSHILVGFAQPRLAGVERSPEEAEVKAAELLVRIEAGEDFETLMAESDDSGGGTYTMGAGGYPRQQMAKAFGDVSWRLAVGQVGVAAHDPDKPRDSPFGWHIIKRIE